MKEKECERKKSMNKLVNEKIKKNVSVYEWSKKEGKIREFINEIKLNEFMNENGKIEQEKKSIGELKKLVNKLMNARTKKCKSL